MSNHAIPNQAPEGAVKNGPSRIPAYLLGAVAGAGLLLLLPGQARADGYGHAEITLGFPNGQVTLGKTWDDNPRQVVVEEVTHKLPDPDFEDEEDDEAAYDGDADQPDVVIEKRVRRPRVRHVTVIERYEEPAHCDREVHVVRRVYVEPRCSRPDVVVYRAPQHVIYAPSRTVIVAPGYGGNRYEGRRVHHVDHVDYGRPSYNGGGPRNLFPEDSGRPMRTRGVQQHMVKVGG
jgi:hypothetical protein